MRWLGRLCLAVTLFCALFVFVRPGLTQLWEQTFSSTGNLDQARANTFFPLSKQEWLSFDIPQQSSLFRIYTHAALSPNIGEITVRYTIDYEWLDRDGNILEQRQHNITTRASEMTLQLDHSSRESAQQPTRFYDHSRSLPSRDRTLYFPASRRPQARQLRLRVGSMDPAIEQIGIRPYQQHFRPAQDLDIAWQRMSSKQRESLSKGFLYPSFLLSDHERRNLLSTYWKPIGPLGVLDRDYRIETLYQLESSTPISLPHTPSTDGLFASAQHWISVVLEEGAERYRIEWQPLADHTTSESMQFQWQGVDLQQQRQWQVAMGDLFWEGELTSGLLQLVPDLPGIVKLFVWRDAGWENITPEKRYSRTFVCTPQAALEYALAPGPQPQSLKIDARAYSRADQPLIAGANHIKFQVQNAAAGLVYQRSVELSGESYPYQHFADSARIESVVFEPLTSYLEAHPESQKLRVECSAPSLISVYTRPWQHPVNRRLPAQENRWRSYGEREPAWFTLLPENVDSLIRQKLYYSLLWYFKPVALDSFIAAGNYSRQSLVAESPEALEWQVFSGHSSDTESRIDSRGSAFQPLVGSEALFFAGRSNEQFVQPTIVYLRDNAQPQSVQFWVDDSLTMETTVAGKSGKFRLPQVSAGRHRIELRPQATNWYLNNTAHRDQTHLLRTVYSMISDRQLAAAVSFPLQISGKGQQLSIWLYAPDGAEAVNCKLAVQAERDASLQHNHSLLSYQYQVAADDYPLSHVLQRAQPRIRGPIRLLIPLGTDLPAQSTTAQLECDQSGVLASAGLLSEGLTPFRYFKERHAAY